MIIAFLRFWCGGLPAGGVKGRAYPPGQQGCFFIFILPLYFDSLILSVSGFGIISRISGFNLYISL